jgi:hypothetical protein
MRPTFDLEANVIPRPNALLSAPQPVFKGFRNPELQRETLSIPRDTPRPRVQRFPGQLWSRP